LRICCGTDQEEGVGGAEGGKRDWRGLSRQGGVASGLDRLVRGGWHKSPGREGSDMRSPRLVICGTPRRCPAALADGDRFIPTRDGTDLHAAYQLLPDNGQDDRADASSKPKNRRKSAYGQGTDVDARRGALSPARSRWWNHTDPSQKRSTRRLPTFSRPSSSHLPRPPRLLAPPRHHTNPAHLLLATRNCAGL
jgi:hypothetical protein